MISPEILRHFINQSDAKQNSIVSWLTAFSRASVSSLVLTLSSHWLLLICPLLVIGRCDHLVYVLRHPLEMHSIPHKTL